MDKELLIIELMSAKAKMLSIINQRTKKNDMENWDVFYR